MYEKYLSVIDERAEEICAVSDALWDNPEVSYAEYEAVKLLTAKLEENGFTVERGLGGIPTALPLPTAPRSRCSVFWRSMTVCPA